MGSFKLVDQGERRLVADEALVRWAEATGELLADGLNALSVDQAQQVDRAVGNGARMALVATLDPVCVRIALEVPGGEPITVLEAHLTAGDRH